MHGRVTVQKLLKGNVLSHTVQVIHEESSWGHDWTLVGGWFIDLGRTLYQAGGSIAPLIVGDTRRAAADSSILIEEIGKVCEGSNTGATIAGSRWIRADATFDQIQIIFRFWSEDDLKRDTCRVIMRPVKARIIEELREQRLYQVGMVLNKVDLDSETLCFSAGAQDDGWFQNFAIVGRLDLIFTSTQEMVLGGKQ